MKKLIFVGGIGKPNQFVGGELTKNKNILEALRRCDRKVYVMDTNDCNIYPWRLMKLPILMLLHPRSPLLVSTSLGNAYPLFKLLTFLKTKRTVSYIGTGGAFSQWLLKGRFLPKYLTFLKIIAVQGKKMQEELNQAGLTRNCMLINNKMIVHIPDLHITRKSSSQTNFVFLSRVHPDKGVDLILNSCERLNALGLKKRFCVTFYGKLANPEYEQVFRNRIDRIENVQYNGILNLRTSEGYDKLSQYDVMLFPSFWKGEGFPGIVIDALIAGLPIIISDWNFNKDCIVENKTGFIIKSQDEDALFNQMKDAIENKAKYSQLSKYCQEEAHKYDTKSVLTDDFFNMLGV